MAKKTRLTTEELSAFHDGMCALNLDGEGASCSCLVHWIEALQSEADMRGKALLECVRVLHEKDEHFNGDWMACDRPVCVMVRESLKS